MSLFPLGAFGCSHPTLLYTNTDVVFSPCVNEISLKHNKAVCTKPKQTNKQTKNQKKTAFLLHEETAFDHVF